MQGDAAVATVRFRGRRYRDHALDALALAELSRFLRSVSATVEINWVRNNLGKKHFPTELKEVARIVVPRIMKGNAQVEVRIRHHGNGQLLLLDSAENEIKTAFDTVYMVYQSVKNESSVPQDLSINLLKMYAQIGNSLPPDSFIGFAPNGKRMLEITHQDRRRLSDLIVTGYEHTIDLAGSVVAVNVRDRTFSLDSRSHGVVSMNFSDEEEQTIVRLLMNWNDQLLVVRGIGSFNMDGNIRTFKKIEIVESLDFSAKDGQSFAEELDLLVERVTKNVPDGEWDKIPTDFIDRLDDYLYGRDS